MRLYLLRVATMDKDTPVPSYLLRTAAGRHILVDTGLAPELVAAAREPGHRGPPIREYVPVLDQLTALGVCPEAIDMLISGECGTRPWHRDLGHAQVHG